MRRIVSHAAVVLVIVLASTTPAAASSEIGLSRDGIAFAPKLDAPLFDPATLWVPGDVRTETFYVRNQATDNADMSIDVIGASRDSLMDTGALMVSLRGSDAVWHDVTDPGMQRVVSAADLASGRAARIDVKVALLNGAPNMTQVRHLDLDVRVLLSQDTGRPTPVDSGLLPDTGAPTLWSLIVGLCLVAVGTVLVQSRREKENHHV